MPCGPDVVVKFSRNYNSEVHNYCHSKGFAPALKSVQNFGDYIFVVMEKLKHRDLQHPDLADERIRGQFNDILGALKMKNYVHGDMRACNIQFDEAAKKVYLIDFDWAGVEDEAVYPTFMNSSITWPPGVACGQPLRHEHDVYWVNTLFESL